MRTTVAVGPAPDGLMEYVSTCDRSVGRVSWRERIPGGTGGYLVGVMRELHAAGVPLTGARVAIASDIPIGAGLASSGRSPLRRPRPRSAGRSATQRLAVAGIGFAPNTIMSACAAA